MTKIYLSINISFTREIKKVGYRRKGILILFGDFVEFTKVNT